MKILFIGDVVGETGCKAIREYVPQLKTALGLDFIIANAENAAFHGINRYVVDLFYAAGVDGITSGNHMWDQKEIFEFIDTDPRLIRPMNWQEFKPGKGHMVLEKNGMKLLVVNALGALLMGDKVHCPFKSVSSVIDNYKMGADVNGILLDFHTETTAEKNAMGTYLDGKVSAVLGTHTHMPTADHHVMPGGTAYQSDVGMTCDYDSNIGVKKHLMLERFLGLREKDAGWECADGPPTLCGAIIDVNPATGLANSIEPVRIGGRLSQTHKI